MVFIGCDIVYIDDQCMHSIYTSTVRIYNNMVFLGCDIVYIDDQCTYLFEGTCYWNCSVYLNFMYGNPWKTVGME